MLWLCLHFPLLPLSALDTETTDAAVVDQRGAQRWLITGTSDCAAGTPLSTASALYPELRFKARKPGAEQDALRGLGHWAYRFGQPVTVQIQDLNEPGRIPRALLWVEVGQSLALFGGLDALRDLMRTELMGLGHTAQTAVAPTRAGAALLACADTVSAQQGAREAQDRPASAPLRSGTVTRPRAGRCDPVLEPQDLHARLAELPITLLHWPGEVLSALSGVGLRRLGELFALPREAFSRRFGAAYRTALDRLLGAASEPCEAIVPPETFHRRFELASEIEDVERLQFPLKRLCSELQAYLRARDRGLRSVTLAVAHAGARETRIHARFVDPHRDAARIFDALRERLERDGLPLAARELLLIAEDFAEASVPQADLFDARAGQARAWAAAVERIRARLGETRVWSPSGGEDHRPEYGTSRDTVGAGLARDLPAGNRGQGPLLQQHHRPTFLLPEPWPMPPPELPANTAFERIESGWWDGRDVQRDYTTLDINGGRAWVFRDRATQAWHLHGWWS